MSSTQQNIEVNDKRCKPINVNASYEAAQLEVAQSAPDSLTSIDRINELGALLVRGIVRKKLAEFRESVASAADTTADAASSLTSTPQLSDSCPELSSEVSHD